MEYTYVIVLSIAFLATAMSTVVGFGSALILIAATSIMYDIKWGIAISTFLFFYNTLIKTMLLRVHIDFNLTIKISLLALVGVVLGSYFLISINPHYTNLLLAIVAAIYLFLDVFSITREYKIGNSVLYGSGLIYGFLSGAVGSGSIVKAIVFKQLNLPKERYVATMAASALLLNVIKIIIFSTHRLITISDIPMIVSLLIVSYLGVLTGRHILYKISQRFFNQLLRLVLFLLTVELLYQSYKNIPHLLFIN